MRPACCGPKPHSSRRHVLRHHAERVAAVGILLALTACASDRSAQYQPTSGDSATAYADAPLPRIQTEGDGLPAQPPPMRRASAVADDPREPWSPNYGTVAPTRVAEASIAAASNLQTETAPAPEPAKFVAVVRPTRASLFQAKPIDADAVVRRAVAEHEMRRED